MSSWVTGYLSIFLRKKKNLVSYLQFLWSRETSWLFFWNGRIFWKLKRGVGGLTGLGGISSRIFTCNYFSIILLREGYGGHGRRRRNIKQFIQSNINELKEKQITQEPNYIVLEEIRANILFSSSVPCCLTFSSPLLVTFCVVSLFGTFNIFLIFNSWHSYAQNIPLVSWLDWSPASMKTRPQQRIWRTRKSNLYHWRLTCWGRCL